MGDDGRRPCPVRVTPEGNCRTDRWQHGSSSGRGLLAGLLLPLRRLLFRCSCTDQSMSDPTSRMRPDQRHESPGDRLLGSLRDTLPSRLSLDDIAEGLLASGYRRLSYECLRSQVLKYARLRNESLEERFLNRGLEGARRIGEHRPSDTRCATFQGGLFE